MDQMADKQFSNESSCREWLQSALSLDTVPNPNGALILDLLVGECAPATSESPPALDLRLGKWVVRDDDLKLFDAFVKAVVALSSVNFLLSNVSVSAVTGLLTGLLQILRDARRSGAHLTDEQVVIVAILECHRGRPMSTSDLLTSLEQAGGDLSWNLDTLRAELRTLGRLATRKGFVAIVEESTRDEWLVVG